MNEARVTSLLEQVRAGKLTPAAATRRLKSLATHDIDFAKVDGHRSLRKGFPEVIYSEGKTPAQVVAIAKKILQHNHNLLATRANEQTYRAVKRAIPHARYQGSSTSVWIGCCTMRSTVWRAPQERQIGRAHV